MSWRETADQSFAANMRTLREKSGLSQDAIAAAMRERGHPWHQQTVGRVEAGAQPVKLTEAVAVAEVLKTSLDRLTWTSQEASAGLLLDSVTARAESAWEQIAAWTGTLLWAQFQLGTSVAEAGRASFRDSERIVKLVEAAREAMGLTPEDAVAAGRRDHEEMRKAGVQPDDDAEPECPPLLAAGEDGQ